MNRLGGLLFLTFISLQLPAQLQVELIPQYREEIKRLTASAEMISAFELIEEDAPAARDQLVELTEIPAPPFMEEARARRFAELLHETGVDSVWIDEVGNVIAIRRGSEGKRRVAIDAHLDTVFPEGTDVSVRISGDTMFAPGIADDTRGLAILLSMLRGMNKADIETIDDVLIIGSVGEEGLGDLRGVKHLFREEGPMIDSWISIDGGAIGRVSNMGLGSYRYKVTFHGPGGHSWGAFGMVNPHHALGVAIRYFVEAADEFTAEGARTTYNVGRIGGGTSVNSIPFESWMEIDMRSVSPERLDSIDAIFQEAMYRALYEQNALSRLGDTLTLEIEMIGNRPSGELDASIPLIQRAMASTAFFGKRPLLNRGSTNSNIPISLGIPAVTIGRGGKGAKAHSLDEWWIDAEGYKATQLALLILVAESGGPVSD